MDDVIVGAGFENNRTQRITTWFFFHRDGRVTTQPVHWINGHNGVPGTTTSYVEGPKTLDAGWGQWPSGWERRYRP